MANRLYDLGMVGLGVMGRNLLLNMADHGYAVVGLDTDPKKVQALKAEGAQATVEATGRIDEFAALLRRPRAILLLVPAGKIVDDVIAGLRPHLQAGDLVIDGGNSHYRDTDRRIQEFAASNLHFFGMGISGGEAGARHGPSLMPGGPRDAYERLRPILEAVAAKVDGAPCAAYLGPGSAGHYVKMVHNGIEYGVMQLLAETYDLCRRGLGLTSAELAGVYEAWNQSELNSFLVEVTAIVLRKLDDKTGEPLVDKIKDVARQKGTGKWTSQDAFDLQVPIPTIDAAVTWRDLSSHEAERGRASQLFASSSLPPGQLDRQLFTEQVRQAFHVALIMTYAQGMALLRRASEAYGYQLDLATVARIWRGGCIIRAALLEDIRAAYQTEPDLPNLLLDANLARRVTERQADLRAVVSVAATLGIAVPGLMTALAYFDGYRTQRLPTNLIQAQRDYFGAHTYERIDEAGSFHTRWGQ